jgi:uncharacterized protein YecE (DUF72 family)
MQESVEFSNTPTLLKERNEFKNPAKKPKSPNMGEIRIGMSGWTHDCWRNTFYPKEITRKKELEYASRQVSSIEINGTFYALQKPHTYQKWHDETPEDFIFAVKAPQFITHVLRLKEVEEPLSTFMASGLLCLKQKLGPILWQFPPYMTLKDDRFEIFAKLLPHFQYEAAELSRNHSARIKDHAWTEAAGNFKMRHAFEFRHPSFMNPDFIEMLRSYNVAVVFADSGKTSPYCEDLTADFVYLRMHGAALAYKKGYTLPALKRLTQKIDLWASGKQPKDAQLVSQGKPFPGTKDIFVYFDNDVTETSPFDALRLQKLRAHVSQLKKAA